MTVNINIEWYSWNIADGAEWDREMEWEFGRRHNGDEGSVIANKGKGKHMSHHRYHIQLLMA